MCLLLDTWYRTNYCVTVCGKCIFDSNLKVTLPITQGCLDYTCCGNDTDDDKFVGVLHAFIEVLPVVVQRRLNMK